jgi:hypothetical protein
MTDSNNENQSWRSLAHACETMGVRNKCGVTKAVADFISIKGSNISRFQE